MSDPLCRFRRVAVTVLSAAILASIGPSARAAEPQTPQKLWFDATQLPSFTGIVERFLPNPNGRVDRLMLKEGSQIVFPPDAFEEIRKVAPAGRPLVVWGIRARSAPVITMLAFAAPNGEPTVLDRFYWQRERNQDDDRHDMLLIGTVRQPYLSQRGEIQGAILQGGDVVRVEPKQAAILKGFFEPDSKIVAGGTGTETPYGRAIDADRIGESIDTLQPLPRVPPPPSGEPPPVR